MAKLVIFGAGDIARLAHLYFERDSPHEVVAFAVDRAWRKAETFRGLPLVDFETVEQAYPPATYQFFVAVSYAKVNRVRAEKFLAARAKGYTLASYVSSKCTWLSDHQPGENCFILEDNTIQPFVRIGENVTLWSGNHIGHDVVIEDHVFIASHVVLSGYVHIEPYCFLGVNATLRNGIRVRQASVIGAGAILMKDTIEKGVYLPERAKLFDKRSDEIEL